MTATGPFPRRSRPRLPAVLDRVRVRGLAGAVMPGRFWSHDGWLSSSALEAAVAKHS